MPKREFFFREVIKSHPLIPGICIKRKVAKIDKIANYFNSKILKSKHHVWGQVGKETNGVSYYSVTIFSKNVSGGNFTVFIYSFMPDPKVWLIIDTLERFFSGKISPEQLEAETQDLV